jgi:uncharacterized protein
MVRPNKVVLRALSFFPIEQLPRIEHPWKNMKIGVLSDTHGDIEATERACQILRDSAVHRVIHCGDIGDGIVPLLKGMTAHFVLGNIDDPGQLSQAITDSDHTLHDAIGTLELDGLQVAFLHGHDLRLLHRTIHSGDYDLVCHGHSHLFSRSHVGRTLVVNPGAISRTDRPTLAIVDLPSLEVEEVAL